MKNVIVIAEAGVNHNGSMELAYRLIDAALDAGADYVKFQTFIPDLLVSKMAEKAEYQIKATGDQTTQQEMLNQLALSHEQFKLLFRYCAERGIGFLSTAFDNESLKFINDLGLDYHKIPSGEITNLPYLKMIAGFGKKIILSTGMSTLDEVKDALTVILSGGIKREDVTVLQCTTEYPAPYNEVNLMAMKTMGEYLDVSTGFSDHTQGIEISIASVALGATIVEKHFTIDKNLPGPDHKASLEPDELKQMIRSIRNVEMAKGNGIKIPANSEIKNIAAARRSIHLASDLPSGHLLVFEDLIMKRPGTGISPMLIDSVIGKKLKKSMCADSMLNIDDFE